MALWASLIYSDLLQRYLSLKYSSICLPIHYSTCVCLSVSEYVFVFVFLSMPGIPSQPLNPWTAGKETYQKLLLQEGRSLQSKCAQAPWAMPTCTVAQMAKGKRASDGPTVPWARERVVLKHTCCGDWGHPPAHGRENQGSDQQASRDWPKSSVTMKCVRKITE